MTSPIHSPITPSRRARVAVPPHYQVAFWLIISAGLLAMLIPGGPVENRDFSHIHPLILGSFNLFLTSLDLGSLALVPFVLQRKRWAIRVAYTAGISYLLVYALDLAGIFPRSPTAMTEPLVQIEMLGLCAAIAVVVACSETKWVLTARSVPSYFSCWARLLTMVLIIMAVVAIVAISTEAAMSPPAIVEGSNQRSDICELGRCASHRMRIH